MIKQPEIIEIDKSEGECVLRLRVPEELVYFDGHFPHHPILPGVVQLRWAEEMAKEYGGIDKQFQRFEKLKFQKIISKGDEITLSMQFVDEATVTFQYKSANGQHSSGKIVFA